MTDHLPLKHDRESTPASDGVSDDQSKTVDQQQTPASPTAPALAAYAELAASVVNERPLGTVLRRVVELAVRVVPGADDVSITLIERGRARTVAFTGQLATALDERQYKDGFGPCMDAAITGQVISIDDTARNRHYPEFSRQARRHGIHHTLSIGMPTFQDTTGALNIYGSGEAGPFAQATRDIASTFASYAAIAMLNAALYAGAVEEITQMRQAMASRAGIEQAKGVLMRDRHCTADEAFDLLRDMASRTSRKLRDVAQAVLVSTITE